MDIAAVVDAPPFPEVEICSIFEENTVSMIEIDLPSTTTRNFQAAGNKKLSNSLSTDEKLIDNVESSHERGINR